MVAPGPIYTLSESRNFPGLAKECREARLWARGLLCLCTDVADAIELVTSEFFSNAITYSASGRPGGEVSVCVVGLANGVIHLEVIDQGQAATTAAIAPRDPTSPGGCGLFIAEALLQTWGRVPAEGDPRFGVFAATPKDYTGPMVTWADFSTAVRH